jgi:hypothetical protein
VSTGQEFNNRSQGQRIRRTNERVDRLATQTADNAAQTAQAQRDIRVLKARLASVEQASQQKARS